MERSPTIHVKIEHMAKVLFDLYGIQVHQPARIQLLQALKPYQLKNRYEIKLTDEKVRKRVKKMVEADNPVTRQFNGLLSALRLEANHKNIKHIRQEDKEYLLLKEVAQAAFEFSTEFEITPMEEGLKYFIQIGMWFMGKRYALNKFKYYRDKIFNMYESLQIYEKDPDSPLTQIFYDYWQVKMLEATGMKINLEAYKMADIVFARQQADKNKADYKDWIEAQFHGLAFLDAIPEINQLHGVGADGRYMKYLVNVKKKIHAKDVGNEIVYSSPAEENYWKVLEQ